MNPQRAVHAKVLEQDTSKSGSEFGSGRIGCSSDSESRSYLRSLWKDVDETTSGHVMGDASAASWRRLELGKVKHLNTSWL